jgi:hypothetical protein
MSQPSVIPPSPPPARNGCLTALLIGVGILMLLPGLCAVLIVGFDPKDAFHDRGNVSALLGFFAISAGGIALIWWVVRRPR